MIEQPDTVFTTHSKKPRTSINISRKGSIVRERCRQLTEIALKLFPDRKISDVDLTYLILRNIGGDKETVRAYKGYRGNVRHNKRGLESVVVGEPHQGYLELFGFMHPVGVHFWVIHAQTQLAPNSNESIPQEGSKEKISISTLPNGKESEKTAFEKCRSLQEVAETKNKINNNIPRDREILIHKSLETKLTITAEDRLILGIKEGS